MTDPQTCSTKSHLGTIWDWCLRHPYWVLTLLTVVSLAPFLTKPFNIDDPLAIWAAQQIQSHPGNPYGFNVNWYGFSQPMWAVTQNPPLMSYYLAMAALIFGWNEIGLHFACLLPAVAAVLGTYRLSQNFCRWPLLAAMMTLFAPGFFLSCTTVMYDVAMLAFWIWAVVFWVEGMKQDSFWKLSAAGTLMALAILTKYNGICLIPLLAAHGWIEKRTVGRWAVCLIIPVAALVANEWWTFQLYGQPHFLASNQYQHEQAQQAFQGLAKLFKALTTLTFIGGCFAAAFFCSPWLWRKKVLALFAVSAVFFVALAGKTMTEDFPWLTGSNRFSAEIQILFWSVGGVCVLALAVAEIWQKRDSGSWLLALWVLGTFGFVAFAYCMVNGRAVLPMAPAVAILIARRLEQNRTTLPVGIKFSLVTCAALSLLAAQADFQLAKTTRKSAEQICAKYAAIPGRVWFEGHWGFQYYMQSSDVQPLDIDYPATATGDILIIPIGYSNTTLPPPAKDATLLETFTLPIFPWFATFNRDVGAGFYSSFFGPLPFAFGRIPPEQFTIYVFK